MTNFKKLTGLAVCLLSLISCNPNAKKKQQMITLEGEAQGTYYSIKYFDPKGRDLRKEIDSILDAFDQCASLWKDSSLICKVNRNQNPFLDDIFEDMFNKSVSVCQLSDGAFDFTVGTLTSAYGFGKEEGAHKVFSDQELKEMLKCVGYQKVRIENHRIIKENPCIRLDFNAIAQGYSVDLIGNYFKKQGVTRFLIDVGGEVLAGGMKNDKHPWIVGIEKPSKNADSDRSLMIKVPLHDQSLVTSGNYRKYFEVGGKRYSHTIDPKTGRPVERNLLSASVICNEAWEADAMATAFMAMGMDATEEYLENKPNLHVFLIYKKDDGSLGTWASPNFPTAIN